MNYAIKFKHDNEPDTYHTETNGYAVKSIDDATIFNTMQDACTALQRRAIRFATCTGNAVIIGVKYAFTEIRL